MHDRSRPDKGTPAAAESAATTILNVDDHAEVRAALTWLLKVQGFAVEEAATGEEALTSARGLPSLILLDLHLPDMDGFEVCRRLKADPATASIPVVHISAAYQGSGPWSASLESGADAFLEKPCHPDVLTATIRAVLRAHRAEESLRQEIERRRAIEAALRVSEERWRSLVSSAPDFIVTTDERLRMTFVNRLVPGLSVQQVIGASALDFVAPEHRPEVEARLRHALDTGQGVVYEAICVLPDGNRRWYDVRAAPLDSGAGGRGLVLVASDAGWRRDALAADQRFLEAEARILEQIARGAPVGSVLEAVVAALEDQVEGGLASLHLAGDDGRTLRCAVAGRLPPVFREAVREVPVGPGQGSCGTAAHLGRTVVVPDIANDRAWQTWRGVALEQGLASCWSAPIVSGQGPVLGTLAVYSRGPRPPRRAELDALEAAARLAGIAIDRARDEEALRSSEERYRSLFENSRDALVMVGPDGRVVDANPAALGLFGHDRESMLGREAALTFADPAERERLEAELAAAGAARDFEARLLRQDGTPIDCLVSVWVRLAPSGRLAGYEGFVRDISRQRRAEVAMRELSRHLLNAQDDERRRLARELHDSTAQDLSAIAVQLAVLRRTAAGLDPASLRLVEGCEETAARAARDLRTLSCLLHPPLLDEAGLSAALRWLVDQFSARRGIEVELELPQDLGRLSRDAEIAVFRTVQEALTNVHRHSGSPRARVSVRADAGSLVVEVRDWGKGGAGQREGGPVRVGVGILGMRERVRQLGGRFEIEAADPGIVVRAAVPGPA